MFDIALLMELTQAKDASQWSASLFHIGRILGFDHLLFAVVGSRHARFESAFMRSNYSEDWRERYDRNGYAYIDPTVTHCMSSSLPLVWEPDTFAASPQVAGLYEEASAYGLRSGVTLPIHGPQGEFGVISFASNARPDHATRRAVLDVLPMLALVRDYAFASSQRFREEGARLEEGRTGAPRLTKRELEVLQWVMVGKSSWEIARITNCSEATVNFHLANVRQKFDVNTRQQAVVKAIGLGLLTPEDHHR